MGGAGGSAKKKKSNKNKKTQKSNSPSNGNTILALNYVADWALPRDTVSSDGFGALLPRGIYGGGRPVVDLHTHSKFSDGYLSPTALVERARCNGVNILALTDHDTMAGIPEAIIAASKFGIRIIPGVEISAVYSPREGLGKEEHVHILAYYSSCGPTQHEKINKLLASIRDGRYLRAKNMLIKLNKLRMPLKWEHVTRIAGNGVAPGRLHVARALVEAGHVEHLKQAFSRYLYDGGPAYATGNEPSAAEVVELIRCTGGVAALAHPWALKDPESVIRTLKEVGLHAVEVYSGEGKLSGFADLAETYDLLKLGGSDFHGRGGQREADVGRVTLPIQSVYEFLKIARPIWCSAVKDILTSFAEDPSNADLEKIVQFSKHKYRKEGLTLDRSVEVLSQCVSSWLSLEEMKEIKFEEIKLKLSQVTSERN